jgi:hypothetical protein
MTANLGKVVKMRFSIFRLAAGVTLPQSLPTGDDQRNRRIIFFSGFKPEHEFDG